MKKVIQNIGLMVVAILVLFPILSMARGEDKENMELLSDKINESIDARNFHDVRMAIEQLMPMMKTVIKDDKKYLSSLKKETEPEVDPAEFEKALKRKTELYDSIKEFSEATPAVLRVKSDIIKKQVKEFVDLS